MKSKAQKNRDGEVKMKRKNCISHNLFVSGAMWSTSLLSYKTRVYILGTAKRSERREEPVLKITGTYSNNMPQKKRRKMT